MEFQRGQDPLTSLNIGCERKLQKGDKFLLVVPAIMGSYGMNPERIEEAIAVEDEIENQKFRISHKKDSYEIEEVEDWVRQVKWEIFEVASGWAQRINNRWTRIDTPKHFNF